MNHRELTGHKVNPANDLLTIEALDGPGEGGACHHYEVSGFDTATNPCADQHPKLLNRTVPILFQNGPIPDVGVNGVTQEALIAICIDRLQGFQSGKFSCRENAIAMTKIEEAVYWLEHRTKGRVERGVEGTHEL